MINLSKPILQSPLIAMAMLCLVFSATQLDAQVLGAKTPGAEMQGVQPVRSAASTPKSGAQIQQPILTNGVTRPESGKTLTQNGRHLAALEQLNVFDAQRRSWTDRRPAPPPAPQPPPPPAVSDKDAQLYGVVIVGPTRRATIKVGPRYAKLDAQNRGFVTLAEGQSLGDWTLAQIYPTHVMLAAAGGQQMLTFTKKYDRTVTGSVAPPAGVPTTPPDQNPNTAAAPSGSGSTAATQSVAGSAVTESATPPRATALASGAPSQTIAAPSTSGAADALKNAQPGSLAAAIAAAQAAQASGSGNQSGSPPANFNPFLQLFPKQ